MCIHALSQRFSLQKPTDLTYFLGIEVTRTQNGLHLMQRKYIIDLLAKVNMQEANHVSTPMATSPKLTLTSGHALDSPKEYMQVIETFSIWLSLDQTSPTVLIVSPSSCILQPMNTGRLQNASLDISLQHSRMVSTFAVTLLILFMCIQTLTGPETVMTMSPLMLTSSIWARLRSHGPLANRMVLLAPPQKLSTDPWPIPQPNCVGFALFLLIWVLHFKTLQPYTVII